MPESEKKAISSLFDHGQCAANTNRELWRKGGGDGDGMSYYEPSIHVTTTEAIAMSVGGTVITMPVEKWHEMALQRLALPLPQPRKRQSLRDFLREPCEAPNWLFGAMCLLLIFNGVRDLLVWIGG